MNVATLADQIAFDALAPETQEAMRRLFGVSADVMAADPVTEKALEEAYQAGFEDAAESMERPYYSHQSFNRWRQHEKSKQQRKQVAA